MNDRQQQGAFFKGGNQLIQGGNFVQHNQTPPYIHVCADADDGFKHLQAHVATSAFDSDEKVDAPKCHPNTRKAVLDQIMDWVLQTATRAQWILWLNGAAGAGKSAIARSLIERCMGLHIALARFFFFRTDPTRNTTKSLVATLAHQLIKCIPDLKIMIITRIQNDPLIFTQSLQTQLNHLIFEPLVLLKEASTSQPTVLLLFDGVDELSGNDNQTELIRIIATFVESKVFPLIVFFGSRVESQLKQEFASRNLSKLLLQVPLDNNYMPDNDIRLFLDDKFSGINETHPYHHLLPRDWPAPELVEEIVAKSSGQFIYASVVVKFVSTPDTHPAQQLDIVRGLIPAGALTPFAQLDALYRHIFMQVKDPQKVMYLLASVILGNTGSNIADYERMFPNHIVSASIPILLSGLTSVVSCEDNKIGFLHASLPDFLQDQSRSNEFYIDRALWSTRLVIDITWDSGHAAKFIGQYITFLQHAQPVEELRKLLSIVYPDMNATINEWRTFLSAVKKLNFGDGGKVYRRQVEKAIEMVTKYDPNDLPNLMAIFNEGENLEKGSAPSAYNGEHHTNGPVYTKAPFRVRLKLKVRPWMRKLWPS